MKNCVCMYTYVCIMHIHLDLCDCVYLRVSGRVYMRVCACVYSPQGPCFAIHRGDERAGACIRVYMCMHQLISVCSKCVIAPCVQ